MEHLNQLLERLNREKVEYVLVGGLAAVFHGVPLVTRDIDICLPLNKENLSRLEAAVGDLHPIHRQTPQQLAFSVDADYPRGLKNIYLRTDWVCSIAWAKLRAWAITPRFSVTAR